jgi:flagellin
MSTITTNIQALTSALNLDRNQALLGQSLERLSSGSAILSPGDNPAGVADADSLGADGQRLNAASSNVQNAISYTQVADGNLSNMGDILNRMSQLTALTQNPVADAAENSDYQQEFQALQNQLRSMIGGSAAQIGGTSVTNPSGSFNGTTLFGSTAAGGLTLGVGDTPSDQLTIPDVDLQGGAMLAMIQQDSSGAYTLSATDSGAAAAIAAASQQVATGRAVVGGAQSSLNLRASALQVEQQNIASAVSSINDVDVAKESTQLAKYNILAQAGASMLYQANQTPQSVLKLLHS